MLSAPYFLLGKSRRHLTEDQLGMSVGLAIQWIHAERKAAKAATQFKAGDPRQNPGGKPKAVVRTDSYEPQERDHKAENARSSVGQVAAAAKISHHKATQVVRPISPMTAPQHDP